MQGPEGLLYWYTTSAILAILTIWNGLSKLAVWYGRRRESVLHAVGDGMAKGTVQGPNGAETVALPTLTSEPLARRPSSTHDPLSTASTKDGQMRDAQAAKMDEEAGVQTRYKRQLGPALSMAWNKWVLLAEVPVPSWDGRKKRIRLGKIAGTEAFWNMAYGAGVVVLSFQNTSDVKSWADQAGWVAVAQIPMIVALAGKNNLVSFLTGITYEKLNFLHRSAGKVCLAGSWIHAIGYLYLLGGISMLQLQTTLTTWGITSLMAFSLIYVCSLQVVRRRIYEFFLVSHICLAALFLGGVIMHWRAVSIWIWPGIGLWAADRLIRILRLVILNNLRRLPPLQQPATQDATLDGTGAGATLTLLTPSTLKLSFPAPFPWNAGQHFYVLVPGMSRMPWELHPFTAATVPGDKGELAFIIRVRDGFTRRMKEKVDLAKRARGLGAEEECSIRVTGAVEGPYGQGEVLSCHEAVVIFAGGSGVSFALAHLLQIIADARDGRAKTRLIKIIWMVKSRLHLNWISPILLAHTHQLPLGLTIELHVHVTKRYNTTLPADPEMATVDWQAYMEQRMARPRRTSLSYGGRKMSTMSWATFADESEDVSGTGTRRGSEYVIKGDRMRRRSTRPALPSLEIGVTDVDATAPSDGEVLRTFTWNEGYNQDPLPLEDEQESTKRSSMESAAASHRSPGSSISNVNWGARAETPRRKVSFADDASITPSHSRRSLESPIQSPSPRRISLVSVDEAQGPPLQPRRRSSGMSAKRKASLPLPELMPDITEMSPRVEMSPTVDAPLDVPDADPLKVDFRSSSFSAHRESALRPPPLAFDMQRSASTQSNGSVGPLDTLLRPPASEMSRSSSAQSATSISSLLQTGSGVITPALSEAGNTFQDSEDQRRRQSLGLEGIVHWHEGRADPGDIIKSAKAELGKGQGGKVQVLVCGPTSLMNAVKEAAKQEMDVGSVLRGGAAVGFHSENFGW